MRQARRPSLVFVVLRWLPYFIGALALGCALMAALSGCVTRPGVTPRSLTWQERDTNHFRWPPAPERARGSVSHRVAPIVTRPAALIWYQPGTCLGWRIDHSPDLRTWSPVTHRWNEYTRHDSTETLTVQAVGEVGFFRVVSFNGQ